MNLPFKPIFKVFLNTFGGLDTKVSLAICLLIFISILAFVEILLWVFKTRQKVKLNVRLVMGAIFLTLFAAEIVLRLSGQFSTYPEKRFGYYMSPYACDGRRYWTWNMDHYLKNKEFSFFRKINSEGLADREFPVEKEKNEYRIIALGDSFTEGDGSEAGSSWPKVLERILNQWVRDKKFSVINAGICGSDPVYGYVLLKDRLLKYHPDLVIVAMNASDMFDIFYRNGMERFRPDGAVAYSTPPKWEWLYAVSHIVRLIVHGFGYNPSLMPDKEKENINRNVLGKLNQAIQLFVGLAKKDNFKFLLVFCPFQIELDKADFVFEAFSKELKTKFNIPTLNMLWYFRNIENINEINSHEYFWPEDKHPNAKGYAAIARGVGWKMREMGIVAALTKQ